MSDKGENMGKKIKTVVIIVCFVCLIGGYFIYLTNKEQESEDVTVTAVQQVILKNLDNNYPPTPKEVVKYYSEITKCLYNEKYSDEEFEQMAEQMMKMYDDELLEKNPKEQYLVTLKSDVHDFLEEGYSIVKYTVSNSTDVEFSTVQGREYAKLYCNYSIKTGANYVTSREIFELRKDAQSGHWKILGFQIAAQ